MARGLIYVTTSGSFKHVEGFLGRMQRREQFAGLGSKWGPIGVTALKNATPVDSAETADAWYYEIEDKAGSYAIHWVNSHMQNMIPIAAILQYGHATRNGGYVQGIDYINPALRPIFQQIADDMWKVVTR